MNKLICTVLLSCMLGGQLLAARIATDVSPNQSDYQSIKLAIQKHYLRVDSSKKFNPNGFLTRRDAARLAKKLDDSISASRLNLTKAQQDELLSLSATFKGYLVEMDAFKKETDQTLAQLSGHVEQATQDISRLHAKHKHEIETMKKEHSDHVLYLSLGIIAVGILGVL